MSFRSAVSFFLNSKSDLFTILAVCGVLVSMVATTLCCCRFSYGAVLARRRNDKEKKEEEKDPQEDGIGTEGDSKRLPKGEAGLLFWRLRSYAMKKEIPVVITSDVEADDKLNHKDCGALRSILACSSESTTMLVDSMSSMNLSNNDADFAHRDRTQSDVESGINPDPGSMSRLEVRVLDEVEVHHVAKMHEAVQLGLPEVVREALLVAEQARGLADVVDEMRLLGGRVGGVVIDDDPLRAIHAWLEGEVAHPRGALAELPLLPCVVMVRLHLHVGVEHLARETAQQEAGKQPVEIAFVREDNFRLWECCHRGDARVHHRGWRAGNWKQATADGHG